VSPSLTVNEVFSIKWWCDFEIGGKGHSRSLNVAPLDRSYTTYYRSAIVSIALSCTIFELFDVKSYRDLEICVLGLSRSLIIIPFES